MEALSRSGPEHAKLIASYGGIYENRATERAVARVVGRLVAASDDPSRSYRVTILNSPAVNAFALPSGDLFVTRGLVALASDEAELAAVIAHEIAHVTAQHAAARERQAQAVAVASRVVGNMVDEREAARLARETTELSIARFSQAQELEADAIGVRTLAEAGFDPYAAARFLEGMNRFASLPEDNPGAAENPDFLSSHPTTPARIDVARRTAARYAPPGTGERNRERYLKSIDGLLFGDDPREGFVRGRSYLHADLGIAFTVPRGYRLRNTRAAVLATDGARTAIRFDGVAVPPGVPMTDYLASGWVNGLEPGSIRPVRLGGEDGAVASASVEGWSFRIAAVRVGPKAYRFIFASSGAQAPLEAAFEETVGSFRVLPPSERAALRPLRLRIYEVRPGDTPERLATRMRGVEPDRRLALFNALNGLPPGASLTPGSVVKIVSD